MTIKNIRLIFNNGVDIDTDWEEIESGTWNWNMNGLVRVEQTEELTVAEFEAQMNIRKEMKAYQAWKTYVRETDNAKGHEPKGSYGS